MPKGEFTAKNNPEISEKRRTYYKANRDEINRKRREFRGIPENREKNRAYQKARRDSATPEQIQAKSAYMRAYHREHRGRFKELRSRPEALERARIIKRKSRLRKYGLSVEEADKIFAAQGNSCGICKSATTGNSRDWHVDHDHATGIVRGILCSGCNTGLGGFRDRVEFLHAAISYLQG